MIFMAFLQLFVGFSFHYAWPKLIMRQHAAYCSRIFHLENSFHLVSFQFISFHFTSLYLLAFLELGEETSCKNAKKYAQLVEDVGEAGETRRTDEGRGKVGEREASLAITKAKWIKIMQMSHKINYESYKKAKHKTKKETLQTEKTVEIVQENKGKTLLCCRCCCNVLPNDGQRAGQKLQTLLLL